MSGDLCGCGRFPIGACVDCRRWLCQMHALNVSLVLCDDCLQVRSDADEAAVERRLQAMLDKLHEFSDPVEAILRASKAWEGAVSRFDAQGNYRMHVPFELARPVNPLNDEPTENGSQHQRRRIFMARAAPSLVSGDPEDDLAPWNSSRIAVWFAQRAATTGVTSSELRWGRSRTSWLKRRTAGWFLVRADTRVYEWYDNVFHHSLWVMIDGGIAFDCSKWGLGPRWWDNARLEAFGQTFHITATGLQEMGHLLGLLQSPPE